ncbi:MAG: helix-turn-helix domain-containing protein [Nitrospirae bacterium]|nr:helix-turn-helix domain-containing protein [Nitrospirota bacterium]
MILAALRRSDGIQSRAAKALGISERVLRYKIKKYRLQIKTKLLEHDIIVGHFINSDKTAG